MNHSATLTDAVFPVASRSTVASRQQAAISPLNRRQAGLPNLSSLGLDLLNASKLQRLIWPVLPLLSLALYALVFSMQYYLLLPLVFVLHFLVSVTFTHDVLHGAAGFKPRSTEWVLFAMSILLLESGHAFRQAHLHHHSHCLEHDDFEGSPARLSLLGALKAGPGYIVQHWLHAYRLAKNPVQKRWMLIELHVAIFSMILAALLLPWTAGPLTYCIFMYIGTCLYPITTAWLPHFKPDNKLLGQARSLRGKIIPALLFNLSYHLEHHLYPQVPSYKLPQLANRLDPYFSKLGVAVLHVV